MALPNALYRFGRFELEPSERRLLCGGTQVPLPGKAFDLLVCLVERAPRLLRKDELFAAVWPDTIVEESNLNYTMSIVRKALQDGPGGARVIETVPRQGYRFVASVERVGEAPAPRAAAPERERMPSPLVQREHEIEELHDAFSRMRAGRRQVVFITGEAGVGKTSLVQQFLRAADVAADAWLARGQCVEHRGQAEAYMPVLEAFGRLGRQAGAEPLVEVLDRFAPSWLVEMPSLIGAERMSAMQQRLLGHTRERMLREMEEAVVAATAVRPLVLVVEDLHWSDLSTLDLIVRLSRSDDPARLLFIGTYRSAEARAAAHPLHAMVQELQLRGRCRQIPLGLLTRSSVGLYLEERFGGAVPPALAHLVHARTEGSPLFVEALLESWRAAGILTYADGAWSCHADAAAQALAAPESLRGFLEEQTRQLPRGDREVLEAAATAGAEFTSALVAAALESPPSAVEAACARLATIGRFVRAAGHVEYPDGSVSDRYDFVHAFYMEVLYGLLPAGRRVRMHQQIALALEALYGERRAEIAAQLATHFVEARDPQNAVYYLQLAASQSLGRSAPREAIARLQEAEQMLPRIADLDRRREHELSLQSMLATALTMTRGFSDAAAEAAYRRAYDLARSMDTPRLFPIAFGLATMLELRGQYRESQQLMEQHLPEQEACGTYVAETRDLLACSTYHQGAFDTALGHALKGLEGLPAEHHSPLTGCFGEHPGVGCYTWAALSLWFLGRPDQALAYARRAVSLAEGPGHLYSLTNARAQLACLHQFRREPAETERWASLTIELGEQQGFTHRVAIGQVLRGWARGAQRNRAEGIAEMMRGLDGTRRIGMELDRPYFLGLFAEILAAHGERDRALATLDEALELASRSRSFFYEAELWRLRGDVLLSEDDGRRAEEADGCYARAAAIAMKQDARVLLLRAELARTRMRGDATPAGDSFFSLTALYERFDEGFDTPDLLDAARFLGRPAAGGHAAGS